MCAIGRDGNNQMYPIAWVVVEGENIQSWNWFLLQVQKSLALGDGAGVVIISDQHLVIPTPPLFFPLFYTYDNYSCVV